MFPSWPVMRAGRPVVYRMEPREVSRRNRIWWTDRFRQYGSLRKFPLRKDSSQLRSRRSQGWLLYNFPTDVGMVRNFRRCSGPDF